MRGRGTAKRRGATGAVVVPTILVAATGIAAAGPADSVTEDLIRTLNTQLLYAAIPVTVLVEGVLVYTVLEYRQNDEPKPTKENRLLEITWTVATAIILLFVGVASYQVLANPMVGTTGDQAEIGDDAMVVDVVAQRYSWSFNYTGEGVQTTNELVVPTNRTVVFRVTSRDWLHAFHVPGLALKQDAFPGRYAPIRTEMRAQGTYQGYCAEYCGVGHSEMTFQVRVVSQSEYRQWLQEQG